MIILVILGAIFLILFLLLFIPIKVELAFDGTLHATLKFLFFKTSLTDQPEKEVPAVEEKKEEKSERSSVSMKDRLKLFFKREGISGLLSFVTDLAKILLHSTKELLSHVQIRKFHLQLCIACGDAYETALLYGKVCAVASSAYSALFSVKKCKDKTTAVTCDYNQKESTGSFSGVLSIRPFFIVGEIVKLLAKAIPILLHFNKVTIPSPAPSPETN